MILQTTVDQEIAAPILGAFYRAEQKSIQPRATFGNKPQDRAAFIEQAVSAPDASRADVVWTDDIMLMIDLQRRGLLKPHAWKSEATVPADMRAADSTWCGFAAIARVLIVNTEKLPNPKDHPRSVDELADPRWKNRCAVARPIRGTSAIHAAVIAQIQGMDAANEWFTRVAANVVIYSNNDDVATAVAKGEVEWGVTDSTDAVIAQDKSRPVAILFPDQATNQPGTVRIPNAIAILANAPHPVAAQKLADFLVLPTTEERLAMSDTAQLPLSRLANFKPRVLPDTPIRWAKIDFNAAEANWQTLRPRLEILFNETER